MRQSVLRKIGVVALCIATVMALGLAEGSCPQESLAHDFVPVETEIGSFEIDVCVTHDALSRQNVYTIVVRNVNLQCPIQSFGLRPLLGVEVSLQSSPMWWPEEDEPHWWMWDGPSWQGIGKDSTRTFSFRVRDSVPIMGIAGAVFTGPTSACGARELPFEAAGIGPMQGASVDGEPGEESGLATLCTCTAETKTFALAPHISVARGYRAEYVVAPSGLNVPSDVAITRDGEIFVTSSRARAIYRVDLNGTIRQFASSHAYSIDVDAAGRLYGYNYPDGEVVAFDRAGRPQVLLRLRESACESALAVAADGTLYIALNYCMGDDLDELGGATLYRLRPGVRDAETILDGVPFIDAIDVSDDGTVYVVTGGTALRVVDVEGRRLVELATLRFVGTEEAAWGLAVARDGSIYVATGAVQPQGSLYRYAPTAGSLTRIATLSDNGLQGIEVHPDGSVIAVQRAIGGLQRIAADGTTSAIVEPNGLVSPQAITATPCGELVVVNDEAGWASIVCPDGTVRPFVKMISYIPPLTYVASSAEGWIVAGESAPGFPSRLVRYSASGKREVLATDLLDVSGVAVASDGSIYAAATRENRVVVLLPAGGRRVVCDDVHKPQALALSQDGRLFAIINRKTDDELEASDYGDAVVEILSNGAARLVAEIPECTDLALDEAGSLYVATQEEIRKIDRYGNRSVFASGFEGARGVAFLGGILYVTDDVANSIIRIVEVQEESPTQTVKPERGDIP